MASTPEGRVKAKAVKQLKAMGAYYFFPVTGGFGKSGIPDIIGCYKGRFFAIECKAGNNRPTPLQAKNLRDIEAVGGITMVVNEDNVSTITRVLTLLTQD